MVNALVASLALFGASASASLLSVGSAHVVNKCSYDIWLGNVPASGGGYEESDKTLSSGESWESDWTSLSNGAGWSIKLSKTDSLENILQYEYTFQNDGIIWYDLSCVNGNPWDANWEITSSEDTCNPKQQAYRYATDDAYGMQSCPQDASITVTLCSGEAADNSTLSGSTGSDSSSSAPTYEPTTTSAPTYEPVTTAAPTYESTTASTSSYESTSSTESSTSSTVETAASSAELPADPWYNWNNEDVSASIAVVTPTTFATQTTAVTEAFEGVTVVEVETEVVTAVVTAYGKRHEHHPHGHRRHA